MNPDYPIIIGLGGKAGVGKTVTAEGLVPRKSVRIDEENMLVWDHIYFALPLYELATIRREVQGENATERQLYLTMEKYLDIFASPIYGGPAFSELVELTYETVEFPISEDPSEKPREFLQMVGTEKCRALNPDVWTQWLSRTVNRRFAPYMDSHRYIMIVSDVRFPNEAEMIMNHPNGLMIKLEASDETRQERLERRDTVPMTEAQSNHSSENLVNVMPFDTRVDTDGLSIEDQVAQVYDIIAKQFQIGNELYAN